MGQQIHYEVHVNKNGRWNISAHFKNSQMEAAIADGKRAEKLPGIKAVKVIRNIFNTQDGIHQEFFHNIEEVFFLLLLIELSFHLYQRLQFLIAFQGFEFEGLWLAE